MKTKFKKPPKIAEMILNRIALPDENFSVVGDLEEEYNEVLNKRGSLFSRCWYYIQVIKALFPFLHYFIFWRLVMFRNYMKVALRNLLRYKSYSMINIFGLAAGLACCLFIFLYVQFELSYDTFHKDVERIYRVSLNRKTSAGDDFLPSNSVPLGPVLKENYPQVEYSARITTWGSGTFKYKERIFYEENARHADPEIFNIFSLPFILGNPETALVRPFTVVITEDIAKKYLGNENPMGKIIKRDTTGYEITGVIKVSPANSHFKFGIIMSSKSERDNEYWQKWVLTSCYTYVKLAPETDVSLLGDQIRRIAHEYAGEEMENRGLELINYLEKITDIHLHSRELVDSETSNNLLYIYIFSGIGILILIIASINFVNLTTARSGSRSCEIGLRKVVGAHRRQLISQFLGESLFVVFIAYVIALAAVVLLLPCCNNLIGTHLSLNNLIQLKNLTGFFVLFAIVVLFSGFYPAFLLSSYRPVAVLKSYMKKSPGRSTLRKILVVSQFAISITLIISTIIVYRQLYYMRNQPLGFTMEQKLVIKLQKYELLTKNYESVKSEFLRHPSITGAAASSSVPGRDMFFWWIWPTGERTEKNQPMNCLLVDHDFIPEYELELAAGRMFQREMRSDTAGGPLVINETAVTAFGWKTPEEALGKFLRDPPVPVIGVIKDFHLEGLQSDIGPLYMGITPSTFRYITLSVNTDNFQETLYFVEKKYEELFPGEIFDYFFLDTDFDTQYRFEQKIGRIFSIFTVLGIVIACLGLFGLASFTAQQRTKEIGIRKVLGASISGIIMLLTREFIKLVGLGIIISWPVAYFVTNKWLQNFAFRINPGWFSFIIAAVIALGIAVFTVSYQSYRSASTNPVDALKYE